MIYTINSSPTSYQAPTLANVNALKKMENTAGNASAVAPSAGSDNESFLQNVIQSLQSLGLNVSDTNANGTPSGMNEALQVFVQNLSQALTPNNDPQSPPVVNTDTLPIAETPTQFSGGTNFKYNVDLTQADLGDNLANVSANLKTALDNIGQYISSKIVFDLKVLTESIDSGTLAQAGASLVTTTHNATGLAIPTKSTDTSFIADSISGVDSSPNAPDSIMYINIANINEMSFSGLPTPDKYDLTSILTHEILHGLAFTGNVEQSASLQSTAYDSLIASENAPSLFFVGRHAKTVNSGNPVPLSPASSGTGSAYYHVAIPNDLMSASIKKGEVKYISALDVAMLEDMGITVTGVLPPPSKVKVAYNNPTVSVQNLMSSLNSDNEQNNALQADFTNLVESLGSSNSSANLQDFLTKLSANTTNGTSLRNDPGAFFSAKA